MKKSKKIQLALNKRVVSSFEQNKILGGGASGGGLASCVICHSDNGCTSGLDRCHFG